MGLVDLRSTGYAVRSLVQAFLDARSAYMPKPRRPRKTHHTEDSQEYDNDFELDLNDPALLVALGEAPAERSDAVVKEARLCEVRGIAKTHGFFIDYARRSSIFTSCRRYSALSASMFLTQTKICGLRNIFATMLIIGWTAGLAVLTFSCRTG